MKYKTYEAETLQQAILKMTLDLGKDALLVSHRNIRRGGLFGIFGGKKMVEVTAALPIKPAPKVNVKSTKNTTTPTPTSTTGTQSGISDNIRKNLTTISRGSASSGKISHVTPKITVTPAPEKLQDSQKQAQCKITANDIDVVSLLQKELGDIKSKMDSIIGENNKDTSMYPGKTGELYVKLIQNGVNEELTERIIKRIVMEAPGGLVDDEEFIETRARTHLAGLIRVTGPIQLVPGVPKVVVLIGTTGVGKTTTLAKLAADFAFDKNKKVVLITVDTYRIAAVEQLRAYADILDIPLEVAFSPAEFKEAIEAYSDYDLMLIDTAGRSQRNSMQMAELKSFIDAAGYKMEINLLLSTTTKYEELMDIIENFKKISFHKIIFTKLDETVTAGTIVNVLSQIPQGISYITTGQNVPEDIEVADANKLVKMILQ
jgi:flagellar biosynthesis protein FlhF